MVTKERIVVFTPRQIKMVREAFNMTQQEFAVYLDVGEASMTRWENAYFRPNKYAIEKLRAAARKAGFDA